jgi:hypothetical protein
MVQRHLPPTAVTVSVGKYNDGGSRRPRKTFEGNTFNEGNMRRRGSRAACVIVKLRVWMAKIARQVAVLKQHGQKELPKDIVEVLTVRARNVERCDTDRHFERKKMRKLRDSTTHGLMKGCFKDCSLPARG